ncbi:hypothetical protein [Pseudomonas syringae]|uniref:hypothetical protein n=1 Tax=Pseudomonas syringae TaxID=317 RepID=UPI0003FC165A|nr:hypothetical protein [Pseudomonas syringae]QGG78948.1 hypothetical protein N028_26865 [Pseudomonas syringae USA011]
MSKSIARVHVNGIEVGSLPTETYEAIAKSVRKDRRLYLAWAYRATASLLRLLVKFYSSLPSVVIGVFLMVAVFWPDSFTDIIAELKTAEPAVITHGLRKLLGFISMVFCVAVLPFIAVFAPAYFRFQSPFDDALSRQIRRLLEVPTEGQLEIFIETPKESE